MAEKRAVDFLKALQIKGTTFGGFDKTATFEKFRELATLYEKILAEEREKTAEAEQAGEAKCLELQDANKKRLQEKDDELTLMKHRISQVQSALEERDALQIKEDSIKKEFERRTFELKDEERRIQSRNEDFLKAARDKADGIIAAAQSEASRIRIDAEAEADLIKRNAREVALRRKAELAEDVESLRKEKETIKSELKVIYDQLLAAIQK